MQGKGGSDKSRALKGFNPSRVVELIEFNRFAVQRVKGEILLIYNSFFYFYGQ